MDITQQMPIPDPKHSNLTCQEASNKPATRDLKHNFDLNDDINELAIVPFSNHPDSIDNNASADLNLALVVYQSNTTPTNPKESPTERNTPTQKSKKQKTVISDTGQATSTSRGKQLFNPNSFRENLAIFQGKWSNGDTSNQSKGQHLATKHVAPATPSFQ